MSADTATPTERTPSPPTDTTAPTFVVHDAVPQRNATQLSVQLTGRDDTTIATARIWYGDSVLQTRPDTNSVKLSGTLGDILQQRPDELGRVHFLLEDASGNRAHETQVADDTDPELDWQTLHPTDVAGELALKLSGGDDNALRSLIIQIEDSTSEWDLLGERSISVEETLTPNHSDFGDAITLGEMHDVSATLRDWAGNEANRSDEPYVRKHDRLEERRVTIGIAYVSHVVENWDCLQAQTEPTVGQYTYSEAGAIARQIDQMQGFGLAPLMFLFNGKEASKQHFEQFIETPLASEIPIEPNYIISHALKWNLDRDFRDVLSEDLGFIRENHFQLSNRNERDSRPTVAFWDANFLTWGGNKASRTVKQRILDEWDSFSDFMTFIRQELMDEGVSPYIIGDIHNAAMQGPSNQVPEKHREWDRSFDAVTTWTGLLRPGETVPWRQAAAFVKENFAATNGFARANGIDFMPRVFPGFDDRHNTCWGADRHVSRSPGHLRELLRLADEYRTTNRINVATWNGWPEGHQIEPGSFKKNNYGTAYLDVIREFQQGKMG